MLEYKGKYASCKVYTDSPEDTVIPQIYGFLNHVAFEGAKIRIMPDVHFGKSACVGFTSTLTDKTIPNVVGVDLSCGVKTVNLGKISVDFKGLDDFIRANIPSGMNHNKIPNKDLFNFSGQKWIDSLKKVTKELNLDYDSVLCSLSTTGGGNHYLSLNKGVSEDVWLTVHSGSRNFGLQIATFHQKRAIEKLGKQGGLEYLEGSDAEHYLEHTKVAHVYAGLNRQLMLHKIITGFFKVTPIDEIESVHNYIDVENKIIRKGAISAYKDQRVVIPWNMRDGMVIGVGKGNEDWNCSAPHGAGRNFSRGDAKRNLSMDEYKETMKGVWSSCVTRATLDESPMAYKDPTKIQEELKDSVEITETLKEIYNFKAS